MAGELVGLCLRFVDLAHLEEDARGVGRLASAVEADERAHVADCLITLLQPFAKRDRVAERAWRLRLAGELLREDFIRLGGLLVIGELVVARALAKQRPRRQ